MSDFDKLFKRLDLLLDRVEKLVPADTEVHTEPGFSAYRWAAGSLLGIPVFDQVDKAELLHLERQQNLLFRNTAQFLDGKTANNALLWGARGTGKSSLIKAQLTEYRKRGLCIIEIPKAATGELFEIIGVLAGDGRKFIIYLDDLSFEANDDSYKALKACLEGSLQPQPDNVIIYATSNRRHLMPESMQDNLDSTIGLWLSFHPFTQDQYLAVTEQALLARGLEMSEDIRLEALRFATQRGSRSGRIAVQFAAYWESLL
jgi:predicted AAA+ superfamily ATPase